ncbi:MAG TPA: ATP-binding protein [Candidatus Acidoferrum sp.]|nr:ATP-binding protein [Candidatus Acidoferrum sp.]
MPGREAADLSPTYEEFFRSAPCFLTVQDRDFRIVCTNENFKTTFGEGVGRYCYQVYKRREGKCSDCPVDRTFVDGTPHRSEQLVTLPDGRQIPILAYTSPVRDPAGQVVAVVEVSADTTPVRRLEDKLRESRERFRLLFEEAPCYISVQDRELHIVQANRPFKEAFGDYIGAYCYEVYKHRGEPCLACPVAITFHDGQSHQSEEVVTSQSGEQIHTLVSTAPIRNGAGEIELVMEMSANITEIRMLQGQLANLGLLVGSISHGIKGLLTGLDGGMYMMSSGFDMNKPERIQEGWQMIRRNVGQIRNVVLDLLYIAKEREPAWEVVAVRDLARNVVRTLKKKAEGLQIEFNADLARDVGECQLDVKSFQAALINIVENALDACRVDRLKNEHAIQFRLSADEDDVVFQIEDNGIGMDRETREKMFSLFFSSKGTEGTGLGLFIAKKVIEKHHGQIQVESRPGEGTRFTVRIPKAKQPQTET